MVHYSPVIARKQHSAHTKEAPKTSSEEKNTHTRKEKKKPQLPKHFTSFSSYGVTLIIDSAAD